MAIAEILSPERVSVAVASRPAVTDKAAALERLAELLANGSGQVSASEILQVLREREQLQSTGVGGGVAVPHASLAALDDQRGALLICPKPIQFDAIDGAPVSILFALVGPKGAPSAHLKVLARVSRLLRDADFRQRLAQAQQRDEAYHLICAAERRTARS